MRRTNNPLWINNEKKELYGIAMDSDFCAEHEWGIRDLHRIFELNEAEYGVERRIIRYLPNRLRLITEKSYTALFCSPVEDYYRQPKEWVKDPELKPYGRPLVCAWDQKSFGVIAYGEDDKKNVEELYKAFQNLDVAFWINIGPFHIGGGLILAIVSRLDERDKVEILAKDLDDDLLESEVRHLGIIDTLNKAGKKWFALSPRWSRNLKSTIRGDIKTEFDVVFWLNPMEQHIHNFGWWTIEDLLLWAEARGPIMKKNDIKEEAHP
jgi:hypothetical protein